MASPKAAERHAIDDLLKVLFAQSRTVEQVLANSAARVGGRPLSATKQQILGLLLQRGHQRATQIALFLGVSKPAVTQIIDAMIQERLVSRRRAGTDRREVELRLTSAGRGLIQRIRNRQRHYLRNALRNLPPRRGAEWNTVLREVTQALAQADEAFEYFCLQCGAHEDGTCVLDGGHHVCRFLERSNRAASAKAPRTKQKR